MRKIPSPRLLPATIAVLASLLVVKSGILLQTVVMHGGKPDVAMVAAANAASTERSPNAAPERAAGRAAEHAQPAGGAPASVEQKPAPSLPAVEGPAPVSDSERALLQDLRQRRTELDARAEVVAARESVLAAAEQKFATRVKELLTLQKKLEGLDSAQKQKVEAGWQGLVKLYEAMKPREAATIFNDLQMPVLLQVLDRMKDAKAASVMAVMNPDKARDVTSELAQMRTGKISAQATPAASSINPLNGNAAGG